MIQSMRRRADLFARVRQVVHNPTPKILNRLRKAKNDTDLLESRATALKGVIKSLLDDDEDMALMQLSELQRR
jgi:hypothetical protein